mgnify:CR=1 FL=1
MKVNKIKLLKNIEILIILVLTMIICFKENNFYNYNILVIISFNINAFIIILNILKDQTAFSLNKTFWYFNFFFFFIAPLFQYLSSYNVWNIAISEELYLKTNTYVMLCYIIYMVSKKFFINKNFKKHNYNIIDVNNENSNLKIIYSEKILILMLILTFISFVFLITNISFNGLFVREINNLSIGDNTISVILENICRAIPIYTCVYSIYFYQKKKFGKIFILIEFIILFMVNFPTSITRYWIGLVYIGIALIFNRKFDICIIIIFSLIFPIFQLFKWYSFLELFTNSNLANRMFKVYNSVDFDAYSMFARTINYVNNNGIQFGHQSLASIFFLIPRALWPLKPYPTGQFIAMNEGQFYTNLSCPLFAEGFIDYGLFGSLIYTVLICYIISKFDFSYWNKNEIKLIDFYYPFLFGILIFLLRGSLQPVIVYSFTFLIFIIILKKICFRKKVYNENINI